jgi:hypothetical protein
MRTASPSSTIVNVTGEYSAIPPRVLEEFRKSSISGTEKAMSSPPGPLTDWRRYIRRPPSRWGRGLSSTPRTTLKMAVLAPMPSPRVRTTAAVKPRERERLRTA